MAAGDASMTIRATRFGPRNPNRIAIIKKINGTTAKRPRHVISNSLRYDDILLNTKVPPRQINASGVAIREMFPIMLSPSGGNDK